MTRRKPLMAGNWKMNMNVDRTRTFLEDLSTKVNASTVSSTVDVAIAPPYTLLAAAREFKPSFLDVASQNVHWEESGAYTGEVSAAMLVELGVQYAIIGHSERRQYFGETDETVVKRTSSALAAGLMPIVCVGESLEERESGKTEEVLTTQLTGLFENVSYDQKIVIAYEPVWAIGTGLAATLAQADEAHAFIRGLAEKGWGPKESSALRILYGGSMKPANVKELLSLENVDGGLIGGASLKAEDFASMLEVATRVYA